MNSANMITILVSGYSGSGKKTFITRQYSGEFKNTMTQFKAFIPTTIGPVDTELYTTLPEGRTPDVIIYIGDMTKFLHSLYEEEVHKLRGQYPEVPVIFLNNKVDIQMDQAKSDRNHRRMRKLHEKMAFAAIYYYSSKSNYNFEKPLTKAFRLKFGQDDIHITH